MSTEIISVFTVNHTKSTNVLCTQNAVFLKQVHKMTTVLEEVILKQVHKMTTVLEEVKAFPSP